MKAATTLGAVFLFGVLPERKEQNMLNGNFFPALDDDHSIHLSDVLNDGGLMGTGESINWVEMYENLAIAGTLRALDCKTLQDMHPESAAEAASSR